MSFSDDVSKFFAQTSIYKASPSGELVILGGASSRIVFPTVDINLLIDPPFDVSLISGNFPAKYVMECSIQASIDLLPADNMTPMNVIAALLYSNAAGTEIDTIIDQQTIRTGNVADPTIGIVTTLSSTRYFSQGDILEVVVYNIDTNPITVTITNDETYILINQFCSH